MRTFHIAPSVLSVHTRAHASSASATVHAANSGAMNGLSNTITSTGASTNGNTCRTTITTKIGSRCGRSPRSAAPRVNRRATSSSATRAAPMSVMTAANA
jgi:hypothetical protein